MQATITVDSLLAPAICAPDVIEAAVLNLLQIKSDLLESSRPPALEDDANAKIIAMEGFPCKKMFGMNLAKLESCVYSGHDIARYVSIILRTAESISNVDPESCADWEDVEVSPELSKLPLRNEELKELFKVLAIRSSVIGGSSHVIHYSVPEFRGEISFVGTVSNICPDLFGLMPKKIERKISISPMYIDYYSRLTAAEMFEYAKCEYDFKLSFYIGAIAVLKERGKAWSEFIFNSFHIGPEFIESMKQHQCFFGQRFFNACLDSICHVLAGYPKNEINEFRESAQSNVQKVRGGEKAWRTHVTKSNEGIRLMFWTDENSEIKLANVGNKNDLNII